MKERFEIVLNANFKDLNPIYFGCSFTKNGFTNGQRIKNFTTISYMVEGSAVLIREGVQYEVKQGDMLITPEGVKTNLNVHGGKIWNSIYIGFDGERSRDFASLPPISAGTPEIFDELYEIKDFEGRKDARVSSWLHKLYSELIPPQPIETHDYITVVKEYIDANYFLQISVADIAKHVNLNPSYLSRVFKQKMGKTIQEYLISVRLRHAKYMLNKEGKNVTEAALFCGFNSPANFSKCFKKYYNCSPKEQMGISGDDN